MRKGTTSLAFILFLVTFISVVVFLTAQYATAPTPAVGQSKIQYNATDNTTYLTTVASINATLINNVPTIDPASLECSTGYIVIDGLASCAWNYGSAFVAYTTMSSNNTLMMLFLGIMLIGLAWAIATLWGGS